MIAAVDAAAQTEIASWVSLNGYPTLRFYVRGQELNYDGARDAESIIGYMKAVKASKLKTLAEG